MEKKWVALIIIVSVLIILGIILAPYLIWNKVNKTINEGSSSIELSGKCMAVNLQSQVNEIGGGQYEVTLTNYGIEEVGAKLILLNSLTNSYSEMLDFENILSQLEAKTNTFNINVVGANKLEVAPYFVDDLGEEMICPETFVFEI
ncbi:hypothetical protein KAI04_03100 [Candidatus Pacearchaeota archaeon]|nr:hypothetical protein [Candidatus Pacearchaeota archaeon]